MVAPGLQEIVSKCKHGREATERRIVAEGGGEGGRETTLNVSFMSFNSDGQYVSCCYYYYSCLFNISCNHETVG